MSLRLPIIKFMSQRFVNISLSGNVRDIKLSQTSNVKLQSRFSDFIEIVRFTDIPAV